MKNEYCRRDLKWPGASSVERKLPWTPFPTYLGKVQEEPFDDGSFARYIGCLSFEDEIDMDALIAYHSHTHGESEDDLDTIGSAEDNDDGIQSEGSPSVPEYHGLTLAGERVTTAFEARTLDAIEPIDMKDLLHKRKNEIESTTGQVTNLLEEVSAAQSQHYSHIGTFGELQGIRGLSGFLYMHGKGDAVNDSLNQQSSMLQTKVQSETPTAPMIESKSEDNVGSYLNDSNFSLPYAPSLARPCSIVVSSAFLAKHDLVRAIQLALPTLDFIERLPLSDSARLPDNISAAQDSYEPNITLSPGMGILTTTLQKLKQKPLPGQKDFISVYDRISLITLRYSRLIVLVSEGRAVGNNLGITAELDDRDTDAFNNLVASTTGQGIDTQVIYVPGGDPQLADWLVSLIAHCCSSLPSVNLLAEETTWERFLRKAGFNAFAAQAILATLKSPDDVTGAYGLAAFVEMSPAQRLTTLQIVLNGGHTLRNVNLLMDKRLNSSVPSGPSKVPKS